MGWIIVGCGGVMVGVGRKTEKRILLTPRSDTE